MAQSLFNKVAGLLLVALNVNFPAKCVSTGFIRFICGCNIHHIIFTEDIFKIFKITLLIVSLSLYFTMTIEVTQANRLSFFSKNSCCSKSRFSTYINQSRC